ncbi:MAG: hypothetical protein AB1758_04990 [Candidatus Eremiobacterota bacterium]
MNVTQQTPVHYTQANAAASGSSGSYSERVATGRLKGAIYAGVGALDLYAAGATTLAPAESAFGKMGPWVCGVMAAGHAIYSVIKLGFTFDEYDGPTFKERTPADRLAGLGHAITALGFAGLTFGMGPMALPLVGIGEIAAVAGDWMSSQVRK